MTDAEHAHDPVPRDGDVPAGEDEEKWPVGFILTIVMVGVYLGWRLIQGIVLMFDWIF
jgi:hypothetical protein